MFDIILRSLKQRKMRTGLTVFGIALGIFAVVVMGGMSEHFNLTIDKSLSLADKITVMPDRTGGPLDESKIREVKRVPGVSDAFGLVGVGLDPENDGGFSQDIVYGIPPDKQQLLIKDTELTAGRYLVDGDGYKAVIGSSLARKFNLKIGDELEVKRERIQRAKSITNTRNFTVVGIMEYTGAFPDTVALIPLDRAQKFYEMENTVSAVYTIPGPGTNPEELAKRIELNVEKIRTHSPEKNRKDIESFMLIFTLITMSAAVLAAVIGGLSVMNTMLMSVSERTKEFGLMKALGAERKNILLMTMGEAAIMGIIGGISGIVAGGIIVSLLNSMLESMGSALFAVTPRLVIIALLFATILGMVCGTYPAYRATRMSPMEALRYE